MLDCSLSEAGSAALRGRFRVYKVQGLGVLLNDSCFSGCESP